MTLDGIELTLDSIELIDSGLVQLRWKREDGRYHRTSVAPGDDYAKLPAKARAKIESHWTPERVDAWQAAMAENEQPPGYVDNPPAWTYRKHIWQRATDEEAAIIDARLRAAPIKIRRLLEEPMLEHESPEFQQLRAGFVQAFGEARTAQLLAPS